MLRRPNIASKESLVRQYDHEVIAQTAIKPFVGPNRDGPGDAAVIAPIHGNSKGLVISCGLSPRYSDMLGPWRWQPLMRRSGTLYVWELI